MDYDDIIYVGLLLFSICFGYYYRTIKDKQQQKLIGSVIGFLIIVIVSGFHIAHTFITILVNAFIILYTSKRTCHLTSFIFSFLYLFFFRSTIYFGLPYPPGHTNLVQMILTLKLVGLAFEVNSVYLEKKAGGPGNDEYNIINPNFIDIVHYSLNYISVLTGPYYRYRTFVDYFTLPFANHAPWKETTIQKIQYVPLYVSLFLLSSYIWPLSYALTDEFDNERSWLYRFWYIWPNFFTFRMRMYIGIVLSECVCTMAGFGAYPVKSDPKPGCGPSQSKEITEIMKASSQSTLKKLEYNFKTILNVEPYATEFCTTFREAMKHWNVCVQYWMAVTVYKRFPSKKYRTIATLLVSAVWHGVYTGYYVCIGGAPFYLLVEDVWVKIVLKNNENKSLKVWEWVVWISKMFGFSYLAIAFHLLTLKNIWHYYNSIYHAGLILLLIIYLLGIYILKNKKRHEYEKTSVQENPLMKETMKSH